MKLKLPLVSPRHKKGRTTVSPYVRNVSSSSHLSGYLIVGILLIVVSSVFFLPKLFSGSKSSSYSSTSTNSSSVATPLKISISSLYNQPCELALQHEPTNLPHAPTLDSQLWFLPTTNCKITGLAAVRVVQASNFIDPASAAVYHPSGVSLSLLSYMAQGSEEGNAVDLARYQILFNQNLIPTALLFDSTKATTLNLGNALYFIQSDCTLNTCSVWKQIKITGLIERIYTQSNQTPIKFAPLQSDASLTLYQQNGELITIIRIDLADPNQVVRNNFKLGDTALQQFGL